MPAPAGSEQTFINDLAKATGLSPQVVQAWVTVEGAYAPGGTGGYNFLNIRESTSRSGVPLAGTTRAGFAQFHSAAGAAKETAFWINRMSNYRGIKTSTKMSPESQLAAIAASPWDSGHYNGGKSLFAAYDGQVARVGGSIIGKVGSVAAEATNPVASAVSVIPGLSDIPGASTVTSLVDAPATIAGDAGKVIGFLFNPEDWLRIGYIIAGGVLTLGGLFILARSVGSSTVQQALGGSSGPAASAATLAAPEVAAARVATAQSQASTAAERTKTERSRRRGHVEARRHTRQETQKREDAAYRKGILDASDAREAGYVPGG